eukprot:TRINITY_DN11434_c0_g1_i1.p1 TRINITY_DN11434_c0_g1~~TRINITY_DN11434_c0_g1_i1.p1  ORF type:complete len:386 (+),score=46.71 TRINITY_DN11434_c0_g1_i1:51-1160(+)
MSMSYSSSRQAEGKDKFSYASNPQDSDESFSWHSSSGQTSSDSDAAITAPKEGSYHVTYEHSSDSPETPTDSSGTWDGKRVGAAVEVVRHGNAIASSSKVNVLSAKTVNGKVTAVPGRIAFVDIGQDFLAYILLSGELSVILSPGDHLEGLHVVHANMAQCHVKLEIPPELVEHLLKQHQGKRLVQADMEYGVSEGSANHAASTCRPCVHLRSFGCMSGAQCRFCHLPHEKVKGIRPSKAKRNYWKERLAEVVARFPTAFDKRLKACCELAENSPYVVKIIAACEDLHDCYLALAETVSVSVSTGGIRPEEDSGMTTRSSAAAAAGCGGGGGYGDSGSGGCGGELSTGPSSSSRLLEEVGDKHHFRISL